MTVCVAAMCEGGTAVIGASDRMLTSGAGDIQFETAQAKYAQLTQTVLMLVAGDIGLQMELYYRTLARVQERLALEPKYVWAVRDLAELYQGEYIKWRQSQIETTVLSTYRMDLGEFISRQREMKRDFMADVVAQINRCKAQEPGVETIFMGNDLTGAHIYVTQQDDIYCADGVGFAAIGIGAGPAQSQFMLAGHTKWNLGPETLWLTYLAKKRAEISPGVGVGTNIYWTENLEGIKEVFPHVLQHLDERYDGTKERDRKTLEGDQGHLRQYIESIGGFTTPADSAQPAEAAPSPSPSKPAKPIPPPSRGSDAPPSPSS